MPLALLFFLRNTLSLWGLIVPCEFQDCFFYFHGKCHWNFDRIALTLYLTLGSRDIPTTLVLPAHEHRRAFHLFVSSLPLFSVLHIAFHPHSEVDSDWEFTLQRENGGSCSL